MATSGFVRGVAGSGTSRRPAPIRVGSASMAEAARTTREIEVTETREVDTYTVTLSEEEVAAFKDEYAVIPFTGRYPTLTAIRLALATAEEVREPKIGDTVRVVEDDPRNDPGKFVGLVGKLVA